MHQAIEHALRYRFQRRSLLIPQKTVSWIRNSSGRREQSLLFGSRGCRRLQFCYLCFQSFYLGAHIYHAAFRCSALRAPSIFIRAARQPLSCPPHAFEIGEACLIFLSAVLGVDSPHRLLLLFQCIGPDWFPRTGYLPVLANSVRAHTGLFQVNLLALARSHSGVGDFHRAPLLGSLFRCWVGIKPSSWPP